MKTIVYYGVSSEKQRKRQSIALQRTELHDFAQQKDYDIVAEFQHDGISGEAISGRPGFQAPEAVRESSWMVWDPKTLT